MLHGGGWWYNPLVLRNAGEGWDVESTRQWEGLWNEDIIELLRLSNEDENTLTIVMTGRQKKTFTSLIMDILEGKELAYDALILKTGDFESTMSFKSQVLIELLQTYGKVEEVVIYDDRKSHLNGFQTLLNNYISSNNSKLIYNMVPVFTQPTFLDPKVERALVEETIERHNTVVANNDPTSSVLKKVYFKKSFLYTGYILSTESKATLINYLTAKFEDHFDEEVLNSHRFQVDFIPFSRSLLPKQVSNSLSNNPEVEWTVKEFGYDDEVFAVSLEPVEKLNTEGFKHQLPPIMPISSKGKSSQRPVDDFLKINNWVPIEDDIKVTARFGPVVLFKVVPELPLVKKQKRNPT